MADSDILGLPAAPTGYVDVDDSLILQKAGETQVKKAFVSDLFGGWRDLLGPFVAAQSGAVAPTRTNFGAGGNVQQLAFGVGDEVHFLFHVGHDMKQAATMYPHIHWAASGTHGGNVNWELTHVSAARGVNFGAESVINLEGAASGVAWDHELTDDATGLPTPLPDTLIICRVKRVAATVNENTDTIFGLTLDIHYPTQMFATKNRDPDFYT